MEYEISLEKHADGSYNIMTYSIATPRQSNASRMLTLECAPTTRGLHCHDAAQVDFVVVTIRSASDDLELPRRRGTRDNKAKGEGIHCSEKRRQKRGST